MAKDCYSARFDEALALAAESFRSVRRKGTNVPYIAHLFQVVVTVAENGGNEDQLIAALLHDYIEDIVGATPEYLIEHFGSEVAELVLGLSDRENSADEAPWRERKAAYLRKLKDAPDRLKLISAADKLHNACSILRDFECIGEQVWERFSASAEEIRWYYKSLREALGTNWSNPVLDELKSVVGQLEQRF